MFYCCNEAMMLLSVYTSVKVPCNLILSIKTLKHLKLMSCSLHRVHEACLSKGLAICLVLNVKCRGLCSLLKILTGIVCSKLPPRTGWLCVVVLAHKAFDANVQ